ncbi:ABC transporter permease [Streptomyces sp. I05A-00742]|uniref:ABC transporter permease n=1 Tax=Streptomyces sp. I05A-00742 TaxID=2732853 RepID=UPI001487EB0B|nr:ABC transporter permease [Streptomyces sp. I05A-00742]
MTELLAPTASSGATAPGDAARPASGARQVWRRLRARKSAVAAGAVLGLLVVLAVAAPLFAALEGQDPHAYHDTLVDSARGGVPLGPFGGISAEHWLGVEPGTGRDLFVRLLYGARVSLAVAVGATLVQVVVGVAVGLTAALGNRLTDGFLGHFTDVMVAMPMLVFAIALTAVVPADFPRPVLLIIVIGLIAWGSLARVVRAQALALKKLDHVSAARLTGSSSWRIARRELLPALAAPVITYAAVLLPGNMILEASMSFLGVGVTPPTPSWGQMLSSATTWFRSDPLYVILPALMLFITTFAFTVLGDALRVALDPREASRLRVGRRRRASRGGAA